MKFPLHPDDFEVIDQILCGNPEVFEILIRKYNGILYKTGRSYHFDHETTQDLMQDTFVDAYCNLSKFEKRCAFKTWLIRIMLNNCHRKKQKNGITIETLKTEHEKAIPMFSSKKNSDTNRAILNKELGSFIEVAIRKIPLSYRMVFSLREITGLNIEETAEALNITPTNVKVRLNRAKGMLRRELEKFYSPYEIFDFNLIYCDAMVKRVMDRIVEIKLVTSR